jgi:capsule polysaccharide export protein KpsE/RkpR
MRDLDGATKIKPLLKEGLLQIKVTDTDPKRAAELANGYAEEMAAVTTRMSVHDGEIRLQFYGAQLNEARDELARAEADLQQIQEKTGILDLGTEARVSIEMVADLRAQIAARQVEIASMGAWATAENPQHRAAEEQLAALRTQLAKASEGHSSQELGLPKSKMPEEGAAYLRAYREVTYREALTEALERQYEAARMDASRVTSVVQVLSPAVVPERKSGPHRALILLAAIIVGFFASSLGVVMYERCRIMLQTEAVRSRVAEICRLLSLRSA